MPTSAPLVLVADDEPSMLELVARHLRTMTDPKVEVIQASDGEEAWRLARDHLPDLVVLDVMMPGMSGWEVCRKIREDAAWKAALAHTGVVMLTGIGENLNEMTSPLYGADAYIDKPFEFEEFDAKIRETLMARREQRDAVVRPPLSDANLSDQDDEPVRAPAKRKSAAKPKKVAAKPKKVAAKPKKVAAKPKKVAAKPKKRVAKPKKVAAKPKKVAAKPKKVAAKPKKVAAKPKKVTAKKARGGKKK